MNDKFKSPFKETSIEKFIRLYEETPPVPGGRAVISDVLTIVVLYELVKKVFPTNDS